METKNIKGVTPSQRNLIIFNKNFLEKKKIIHNLIKKKIKKGGRNHRGKITVYHRGGGHKQRYRLIEFKRELKEKKVINLEYDPNRTTFIARVKDFDGIESYILAPQNLEIGKIINAKKQSTLQSGNCMKLEYIPVGSSIHNLAIKPNKKGQYARAAGTFAQIIQKTDKYARIKLSSGEHRYIPLSCFATLGVLSNENHNKERLGKAGRNRWLGNRPTVRGVAMNPVDHPHGGGEGKTSGGRPSVTPWGKITKGKPTRKKTKKDLLLIEKRIKK